MTTQERKGDLFLFAEALLWSFFPIITILSYHSLPALFSAGATFSIAALFFLIFSLVRGTWRDIIHAVVWKYMVVATFFIIILFYGIFFVGLQYTTAGNASIISLMEVFFSFLILGFIIKRENVTKQGILGAILMVFGAVLVLFQGNFSLNKGDFLILIATIFPPLGNYLQQKARKLVSSEILLFIRNFLGAIILLLVASFLDPIPSSGEWVSSIPYLLINGILLFGISKIFWIESIHRIPITRAISLSTATPAFTLVFAYFILQEIPTIWQVLGFVPLLFGVQIIMKTKKFQN